jgi:F-type H+-transporting ATPase subunit b
MHAILFAAGGNVVAETAQAFGVNWPHLTAQIISFCIVAFLLHRFAYHPILKVLEERRRRIEESLANADKIKQELAKTESARQDVLKQANTQAAQLIAEARAAAARAQEAETQRAIVAAEQIIAKAREAAEQDYGRMMADLRREVGRLVVETTMQVSGKVLTPEDQRRLAEETNRQIAA